MKTAALTEMDLMRAEVRDLRASIVELEERLAEYEGDEEDQWAIWPYCWVVAAWEFGQSNYCSVQKKIGKWRLGQRNRQQLRGAEPQGLCEMHLT